MEQQFPFCVLKNRKAGSKEPAIHGIINYATK